MDEFQTWLKRQADTRAYMVWLHFYEVQDQVQLTVKAVGLLVASGGGSTDWGIGDRNVLDFHLGNDIKVYICQGFIKLLT